MQAMAVGQASNPYVSTRLLLDGQQRLTSLSAVIRGVPVSVRGRQRPIELLFNLEHPDELTVVTEVDEDGEDDELDADVIDSNEDELQKRFDQMTFVVSTRKLESLPQWVRVTDVFKSDSDAPFLTQAGVKGFDDPNYHRYSQRLARLRGIRKYVYRMDVLERSLSYDEVTEIFVRVNSLGAKLRSSDLALAQITAKWRNSLPEFEAFQAECAKAGFDLELGLLLKNLVVFATGQSRFLTVGSLKLAQLQEAWKQSRRGMEFALNFLRSNVGIDSPALLSSPFLLITLAYLGHVRAYSLNARESARLRYWTLVANAKARYSRGSSETILDQDLQTLRVGGPNELIERLRLQVGRLDISADELEGRNQRSSFFKTLFLAFRAAGATDWRSQVGIALSHAGNQHKLQFHHIFPKAVLKKYSISGREMDDIANLCFIGGGTNRQISDRAPSQYFPGIIAKAGVGVFAAQCIPTSQELLDVERYREFLRMRRVLMAARINEFLGD